MSLAFLLETLDEVQYSMRASSEVENLMTSVERVTAYTALEAEPGYSTENYPPETWPQRGSISISNLSFKYTEGGPQVLKDINLSIGDKEKIAIGVAGRTGAGKSSIVAALLRMPEPDGQVNVLEFSINMLIFFFCIARTNSATYVAVVKATLCSITFLWSFYVVCTQS